jgi:hypothetical protein
VPELLGAGRSGRHAESRLSWRAAQAGFRTSDFFTECYYSIPQGDPNKYGTSHRLEGSPSFVTQGRQSFVVEVRLTAGTSVTDGAALANLSHPIGCKRAASCRKSSLAPQRSNPCDSMSPEGLWIY